MVVICPRCKTKLKVDERKLLPQGSRFKCPKCSTVLVVKKPPIQLKKTLDKNKILVAHSNPEVIHTIKSLLTQEGYTVVTSHDGIDTMVKALKEYPFVVIIEVILPKIYGFEVCKRLKSRAETKNIKVVLITSPHDKEKYRREPSSLYGADEYLEDHAITSELTEKIRSIRGITEKVPEQITEPPPKIPEPPQPETMPEPQLKTEPTVKEEVAPHEETVFDEGVERAKRLSRTIINDIYLYNAAKLDASIKNDSFYTVFASELKEGQKLYENRISPEVRNKGNFFNETIGKFIAEKKQKLG